MMIVVVKNIPYLAEALKAHDEVLSLPPAEITNDLLRSVNCTALFVRTTTRVDARLLHDTAVRFVGTATSGVDHLDLDYLEQHDISYCSAAGSNSNAVAEYVVYALLSWAQDCRRDLNSIRMGVVGYGYIGSKVAAYAHALGITVLINDPPLEDAVEPLPLHFGAYRELDELLSTCDVVTNHIPLVSNGPYATRDLFNARSLALLSPGSLFVHSSRGGILDEAAIASAMADNNIRLAIDVWKQEPDYDLSIARSAMIATPHISGHSDDGIIDAAGRLLDIYERFSNQRYDASIIQVHKSSSRKHLRDFSSVEQIQQSLRTALHVDENTVKMRSAETMSVDERMKHFQHLRSSYTGRRELLLP